MEETGDPWLRAYAVNLVERSILQYARGLKDRADLDWVLGMIRYGCRRLHVDQEKVMAFVNLLETDSTYLPTVREAAIARLRALRIALVQCIFTGEGA